MARVRLSERELMLCLYRIFGVVVTLRHSNLVTPEAKVPSRMLR